MQSQDSTVLVDDVCLLFSPELLTDPMLPEVHIVLRNV